jgi:hypothetical protein
LSSRQLAVNSAAGPSPEDEAWAAAGFARKWGEQPVRIRDARDLPFHLADRLTDLDLEADVQGDGITFTFLRRLHQVELTDVDAMFAHSDRTRCRGDEEAMLAGLPVG